MYQVLVAIRTQDLLEQEHKLMVRTRMPDHQNTTMELVAWVASAAVWEVSEVR